MTTMAAMPANGSVPAGEGDGRCKRAGCGRPLPPGERGRSRQFCSDECRIRHYNAMRGTASAPAPPPADGPQASLGRLSQLLAEASRLAAVASAQVAEADPGRVAAVLAEAEAARRRAEAHAATASAQAAEAAESAAAAWEAADAAQAATDAAKDRAQAAEERARELVLPGAEDHHEGGVHDADVGMRESPAAGVTAGLWWWWCRWLWVSCRCYVSVTSVTAARADLPRAFRTADLWLIHAADCCSRYSLWTCCGVRY
jgi:hypothetical protein